MGVSHGLASHFSSPGNDGLAARPAADPCVRKCVAPRLWRAVRVMVIPGLCTVTEDGGWLVTELRPVPALGGSCRFLIDGYDPQESAHEIVACVEAFCSFDKSQLQEASVHVFEYYRDVAIEVGTHEPDFPNISQPDQVWDFVTLTREPVVLREQAGEPWFVALENECAWEREHGLMLVLKEGRAVTKVSAYDGPLTNRRAFADDSIPEDAVYWKPPSSQ